MTILEIPMPNVVDVSPFRSYDSSQCHRPHSHSEINSNVLIPPVLQAGDPILDNSNVPEVPIYEIGSPKFDRIINDLVAAMRNSGSCGLSAPQIGHSLQIIVVEDPSQQHSDKSFKHMVIINPKLKVVNLSETEISREECPSIPGYSALVNRFYHVEVCGLNRKGEKVEVHAKGQLARALQHECDHLEGILYVDKMVPRSFQST